MAGPGQQQIDPQSLAALLGGGAQGGGGGFGAQLPGGGAPPQQGQPSDPNMAPQQGMGGAAGNPADAAIWQAFPSTDPNIVGGMLQQVQAGGVQGLMQLLPQLQQMQQQDEDALYQKQQQTLHAIVDGLIGPNPAEAQAGAGQPPPGVGGDTSGY